MAISGQTGELRVGYVVVARLGTWHMDCPADRMMGGNPWICVVQVQSADEFWTDPARERQFQLVLDIPTARGLYEWVWDGVSVTWEGRQARVTGYGQPTIHDP